MVITVHRDVGDEIGEFTLPDGDVPGATEDRHVCPVGGVLPLLLGRLRELHPIHDELGVIVREVFSGIAAPVPTSRQVYLQVRGPVQSGPCSLSSIQVGGILLGVEVERPVHPSVEQPLELLRRAVHSEDVEVVVQIVTRRIASTERVGRSVPVSVRIPLLVPEMRGAVKGPVAVPRLTLLTLGGAPIRRRPDAISDVELARGRPSMPLLSGDASVEMEFVAQQPERRKNSLALRHSCAKLELSEQEILTPVGPDASRVVLHQPGAITVPLSIAVPVPWRTFRDS